MLSAARTIVASLALIGLSGCGSEFLVDYTPVSSETSRAWTVKAIHVDVPETLEVNRINVVIPQEDIVWYGDGEGDKRVQVAAILKEGLAQGSKGLRGPVPVVFDVELIRFHLRRSTSPRTALAWKVCASKSKSETPVQTLFWCPNRSLHRMGVRSPQ